MKNSISLIVIAMWLSLSSGAVYALSPGPIDSDFVEFGSIVSANFGNDSVASSFEDHFTFNATPPLLGAGTLNVISDFSVPGGFDVHIDSFELWDVTTTTLEASGLVFGDFTGLAGFTGLVSGHDYDIIVTGGLNLGHTSGGYVGNITILPVVPEPETYAMLLIGLCVISFAARSRRNKFGATSF